MVVCFTRSYSMLFYFAIFIIISIVFLFIDKTRPVLLHSVGQEISSQRDNVREMPTYFPKKIKIVFFGIKLQKKTLRKVLRKIICSADALALPQFRFKFEWQPKLLVAGTVFKTFAEAKYRNIV